MDRREFIKHSAAAVAATSVLATACKNGKPNDQINSQMVNDQMVNGMTLRVNPNTGDKVSILGFGMMRLPVQAGGPCLPHHRLSDRKQVL